MLSDRHRRWWRLSAIAWLIVVLIVVAHQVKFWQEDRVAVDILALLPADEQAPEVDAATRKLADAMSRQIIVMLGAPDWSTTLKVATEFREALDASAAGLQEQAIATATQMQQAIAAYRPWRDRLLTPRQHEWLESAADEALVQEALAALYRPGAGPRLSSWGSDPLSLWAQWWATRASESPAQPRDGVLWLEADSQQWAVLIFETTESAFSLTGEPVYGHALEHAWLQATKTAPEAVWIRTGVPLHAEAGATQASREINLIGWGSLAGVVALSWLAFRSLRAIALVAASLIIACAVALSATAWLFGEVHLITLIFGASLVGVAEDYGIHYFANRLGRPAAEPISLMATLLPALVVALSTSVLAYAALGITAFPGLRQMAFFSAIGLVAALITVVAWFPFIDRGTVKESRFSRWLGDTLRVLPRLSLRSLTAWAVVAVAGGLVIAGARHTRVQDDVRQLQSSPATLIADQQRIGHLLNLPSPAQFYLVQAESPEQVLRNEEVLTGRLQSLVDKGLLGGYSAISSWVPSAATQQRNALVTERVEQAIIESINANLGETIARPDYASQPLTVEQWLKTSMATLGQALWLGGIDGRYTSVVMLRGLSSLDILPALESAADGLPGVRWVDRPDELSSLLERYRKSMTWLLIAGHALVLAIIFLRFGNRAWHAWFPTVLASRGTVAILGLMGEPWQLFNVLGLALLLGVGVDYGIFLLEHDNEPAAWLAVLIGAGSTWLSFGLLGLSDVPALRAFGLTLMIGLVLVLLLAPLLRAPGAPASSSLPTPASP